MSSLVIEKYLSKMKLDKKRAQKAITKSKVYDTRMRVPADTKSAHTPEIILYKGGTLDAARQYSDSRVLVLDFASDTNPGGGWRGKQTGTQEVHLPGVNIRAIFRTCKISY